jgi:HD-GYP domain-containing protein (c-di-GMP phosphodiesterase class II)
MRTAGLMHDIGKIGVDETILNSQSCLEENDWKELKRHPEVGYQILSSVNEFSDIARFILEHHEKFDGSGYPKGLKGEEISLQARIIAVADSYDAMTSQRTYHKGLSKREAKKEIINRSNTQFDPHIVTAFIDMGLH